MFILPRLSVSTLLTLLTCTIVLDACAAEAEPDSGNTALPLTEPGPAWNTNGGSLLNQRYSTHSQINADNVQNLKAEWQTRLGSGLGPSFSGQGEPVIHEGVIYHVTGENDVFALSVDTGEILWTYDAGLNPAEVIVCCGWVVRGVAVGEGLVYTGTLDARLLALDAASGEVVWERQVEDASKGYSITAAPRFYDGRLFIGLAGGEYQTRGSMQSFEAATGEHLWTFYTVPGPGEFGHETWPDYNDSWMYGGAPVWQTPAIDPELNMLYFSTGNASPDLNGVIREGDNLFTVSILALDVDTGEYRWHFQQTRHDIWDYDSSSPVVLFDVEKDGVMRKGLSQISKSGYLFLLDRVTGEGLTPIDYVPVPQMPEQFTADTQPVPRGDTMINHCVDTPPEGWTLVNNGCTYTPFGYDEPVLYAPLSGSNWMPTSYDPNTGYLYLCASESTGGAVLEEFGEDSLGVLDGGNMIMGGAFRIPSLPRTSYQVAVDVRDHSIVWKFRTPDRCDSGSTTTASGLMFTGRNDGRLKAYDSATGLPVWEFQLDAGIAPSPVIFEHNGSQKLVVFAAGSLYSPGPRGDSLWLFSLDGTMGPTVPNPAAPARNISTEAESTTQASAMVEMPASEADLARGENIYQTVCNACHGTDGQGGHAEGGAIPAASTIEHIFTTAYSGGEKMPPFGTAFSAEELKSVAAYVHGTVLPRAD